MARLPLLGRLHSRWLAWSIAPDELRTGPEDEPDGWEPLDSSRIERLFGTEPARRERFDEFLRRGHLGFALDDGGRWMAYGWLATPESGPAEHMPSSTRGRWWIFYCRTADAERNRGHYRRALVRLVREVGRRRGDRVFIDTRDDNAAARSAIGRLGFAPAGIVELLRLPKTAVRIGLWRRGAAHGA